MQGLTATIVNNLVRLERATKVLVHTSHSHYVTLEGAELEFTDAIPFDEIHVIGHDGKVHRVGPQIVWAEMTMIQRVHTLREVTNCPLMEAKKAATVGGDNYDECLKHAYWSMSRNNGLRI